MAKKTFFSVDSVVGAAAGYSGVYRVTFTENDVGIYNVEFFLYTFFGAAPSVSFLT